MKSADLETSIKTRFSVYGTVYKAGFVPESPVNPYLTYELGISAGGLSDDVMNRQIPLNIDLYHRIATRDEVVIDALSDAVENGISTAPSVVSTGFAYDLFGCVKNPGMPTTDEFMLRRRLSWTLRYFESE